jgi:hypothetical protein
MKKNYLFFVAVVILVLSMASCGGSGEKKAKSNGLLGDVPSIMNDYQTKIDEKELAVKECTDLEKAFKLGKELELLEDEYKAKMTEYLAGANLSGTEVPFEPATHEDFTASKAEIDTVLANGHVNFKFTAKMNDNFKPQRYSPFLYFKFQDAQGNDIPEAKTVAAKFRFDATPGMEIEIIGGMKGDKISNFAKIVEITKEEYDMK